ncbi:MAG: glycosyltransferase family 2 protein [Thermodesulfobacteriota bacterium]|jgi:GT2 family glycosyltransferase
MATPLNLSLVIVNYNTREDLKTCLNSVYTSKQEAKFEVWVVDNNSKDGSAELVEKEFQQTKLIKNKENLGFAKANNQVIRKINTEYVLLLNPDTIVSDHVFDSTIDFLRNTPEAGMVTCKLVKGDGKLDPACRRSFPSAFDGFSRAVGLSKIFPNSQLFARYNLTFLHENQINKVDAINGAFMMVRKRAIDDVGLLDEDYFMYIEDLDWCFRFKQKGWKIYYVPTTNVIHLKGQSGRKNSDGMINEFFKSMEIFCRKNYLPSQSKVKFMWITLGIKAWKQITLFRNSVRKEKRVTP